MTGPTLASGSPVTKLNLGCGPDTPDGWVNIDKSPSVLLARWPSIRRALLAARIVTPEQARGLPRGIVYADISRRIPADDGTVDFAYNSHVIEHMSRWQGLSFVRDVYRVLRPGGVLRIATPDLRQLVDDYIAGGSPYLPSQATPADAFCEEYNAFSEIPGSLLKRTLRRQFTGAVHQWLYDFESLSALLSEGGFADITRHTYRSGLMPGLADVEHRERSLFIEARKP